MAETHISIMLKLLIMWNLNSSDIQCYVKIVTRSFKLKFSHYNNWFNFHTVQVNLKGYYLWMIYFCLRTKFLTLSWRRPLSYRNKSMDWFLYDNGLRHERVNIFQWFPVVYKNNSTDLHFSSIMVLFHWLTIHMTFLIAVDVIASLLLDEIYPMIRISVWQNIDDFILP